MATISFGILGSFGSRHLRTARDAARCAEYTKMKPRWIEEQSSGTPVGGVKIHSKVKVQGSRSKVSVQSHGYSLNMELKEKTHVRCCFSRAHFKKRVWSLSLQQTSWCFRRGFSSASLG